MRTRLIRPAFFSDERMARLKLPTRFIYIGLWTLCDDAGYFERKPGEIAVALFPWDRPAHRLRLVEAALAELVDAERVRWLDCGLHGTVPTLPDHDTKAGNHAYTHKAKHDSDCAVTLFRSRAARGHIEPISRTSTDESVRGNDKSVSVSVSVSDSVSVSGPAGAVDKSPRFAELVPPPPGHRVAAGKPA